MGKKKHIPIRMCVGCRRRRNKNEMIRWIRNPEGVLVKGSPGTPGRGVYLCPNLTCLRAGQKKMGPFHEGKILAPMYSEKGSGSPRGL